MGRDSGVELFQRSVEIAAFLDGLEVYLSLQAQGMRT